MKHKQQTIQGSKVSVTVLIDYISQGYSIAEFLADYPWISRKNLLKTLSEFKNKEFEERYVF